MVAALIKARTALDPITRQTGGGALQETMICLYASLDQLLERAPLTANEQAIVASYMRGLSAEEISESLGVTRQAASKALHAAVRKLVNQNNRDWVEQVSDQYRMTWDALPYVQNYDKE